MIKINKRIYSFLFLIIITLQAFVFAQQESEQTIKVGWYESHSFQEGMYDGAEKSGYAYEYLARIADYTEWKYEYVYGEWADLFEKLKTGEIDILAGVSATEERMDYMLFPKYAMGTDTYVLYQHSDNRVMNPKDGATFAGKKIGGVKNNRMTTYLQDWLNQNKIDTDIVLYEGFTERDKDFFDNKLDALVATDNNIKTNTGYMPVVKVGEEPYYLAVAKNRKDILAVLNDVLRTLNNLNPNYLAALQIQCYGATLTNSTLTMEEEKWLSDHKELRVGYVIDYLPLCGLDKNGNVKGIVTDVVDNIVSKMELDKRVQLKYVGYRNFKDMSEALARNEIDFSFPVISDRKYLTQMNIAGTFDLITVPFMVAYKGAISDNTFDVIAINTRPIRIITDNYSESTIRQLRTIDDCLESILKGESTCSIISSYRLKYVLNNSKYRNIKTMPFAASINYCIGVNKNNHELLSILNKGISFIDQSSLIDLAYKYIQQDVKYTFSDLVRDHMIVIVTFVLICFFIILMIFLLYLRVTRKSRNVLQRHIDEVNKYNAALLSDCVYFYEFDITKGNISGNFISRKGYDPLYNLELDFPMSYDEFNAIRTKELEVRAATEKEASYWTCEGLINAYNEGNLCVSIRCKSELLGIYCIATVIITEEIKTHHLHAVYICKDVTDIIKEEQKSKIELEKALVDAEQASRAKSMFLSNMSHDIRTPMNAILGFADLMDKDKENPAAISTYLKKLKNSGKYLLTIINNILDMARIESGNTPVELSCMDLKDAGDFARTSFEDQVNEKKQEFLVTSSIKHCYILVDAAKHEQITMNLLSNAVKYTPAGGKIHMHLEEFPGSKEGYSKYVLTISDNGIGMSPEFLEHIFDFFSRERNTTESKIAGTGLGMSIVKKLVDLMGGTIEVQSEPGMGSVFTFTCEYKYIENPEVYLSEEKSEELKDFEGRRILLVEDNEFNAEIAMAILNNFGLKVEHAADGLKCIDMLKRAPVNYYDLIFMDIQMPNMNGYEATKNIRNLDEIEKRSIPIIALTANAFEEDKQKAYEVGMNGHLSKPIMINDLKVVLNQNLK